MKKYRIVKGQFGYYPEKLVWYIFPFYWQWESLGLGFFHKTVEECENAIKNEIDLDKSLNSTYKPKVIKYL